MQRNVVLLAGAKCRRANCGAPALLASNLRPRRITLDEDPVLFFGKGRLAIASPAHAGLQEENRSVPRRILPCFRPGLPAHCSRCCACGFHGGARYLASPMLCAPPASTTGPRHRVSRVPAGRRTPIGMRSHEIQSHRGRVHSRSANEELKIASGL